MNKRRNLLIVLGAAAFSPAAAFGQTKPQPVLIGWLSFNSRKAHAHRLAGFKEGLAVLGWKEGSQILIEEHWADGKDDRLTSFAQELAAKNPALIVASGLRVAFSAAKAAPKIPIVMVSGNDPVAAGLVASLARPGGMITGLTGFGTDLAGKHLELLLTAAPKVKRVGFLTSTGMVRDQHMEVVRRSTTHYAVEARFAEAERLEEIEPALSRLAQEGVQALVMLPIALFTGEAQRVAKFALAQRWPVIGGGDWAAAGALLSYSTDQTAHHRRAAYYVDRILKGTKPGDLPIEQPTTFELVVNMKTARALGLTMPPEIMVRATRVIQ